MFCKNCGKENEDNARYCVACGYDLTKALPAKETAVDSGAMKARTKRIPKIPLIIVCAALVAFFALYQIAANATKPETVVKNYITSFVTGDYGAVYDGLDMPSGKFTSKEQFIASCTSSAKTQKNQITSLSITEATVNDLKNAKPLSGNKVDAAYTVVYSTQRNTAPITKFVMLTKKGKAFLLFDRYEVEPNDFVAQKYSVDAPVGVKVSVDGIELDNTFLSKSETSSNDISSENQKEDNTYTIPNIFLGKHNIIAKSDFTEDYKTPVSVKSGQTEMINNLVIKADIRSKMREMSEKTLRLFFDSAVANKEFTDISSQISIVPTQKDAIAKFYDSFKKTDWSNFVGDTITYSDLSLTNIEAEQQGDSMLTGNSNAPISYRLGYSVSSDVKARTGYILLGNPHAEQHFGITIEFSYENGKLAIYSVGE
jgi:uncharacterized membrane protein YvbJ